MFTQCQHCLTMFRITPEQLKVADGKVRCCQCNNVFNALHKLMESPTPFTNDDQIQEGSSTTEQNGISSATTAQTREGGADADGLAIESSLVSDSEVVKSLDALADEEPRIQQLSEESILEVDENSSDFDSQNQFILEQDDGLETEPEYFAAGTESQMSELLDKDSTSLLLEEKGADEQLADVIALENHDQKTDAEYRPIRLDEESQTTDASIPSDEELLATDESIPTDQEPLTTDGSISTDEEPLVTDGSIPIDNDPLAADVTTDTEGESDHESSSEFTPLEEDSIPTVEEPFQSQDPLDEESRFTFEEEYERPQPSRSRRYWIVGSLLLLLPLSGQITWYLRDNLITHDAGRQLLQGVCSLTGCEVPLRRDTEQIIISERALTAHPEKEEILSLKLEMVNAAAFQQPFPKLQLSLYNDMGKILARRTFHPDQYKGEQYQSQQMMPKLKAVQIELELLDPGNDVTGFKFDFL
ncbi:DUF3426 domain-containing protein [Candidatus Thiodiazotropha sp. CDECU1]|uniref:DUF3426 domain-containing protein n=1 Tax=Candidatus Thiodiazotropha sp. CDECU1 TaxID=3065865 RepID=UPI002931876D|nr:DUF3426 domain-containing protein [Candidatus Thiodiazotropha sp. CDECU1]